MMWNDPQPGRVWQDVLAFQRNTEPGKTSGAELRLPSGKRSIRTTTCSPSMLN